MRVADMNRAQTEQLARRLGFTHPENYNLPELKAAVKVRYHRRKSGQDKAT